MHFHLPAIIFSSVLPTLTFMSHFIQYSVFELRLWHYYIFKATRVLLPRGVLIV